MGDQVLDQKLPKRLERLKELAYNLWWSWYPDARNIFRTLDYPLWQASGHNPVQQLHELSPDRLKVATADPAFLSSYDSLMTVFDTAMSDKNTWFAGECPEQLSGPIAFFAAEFAIHNSLPFYAGGLGVLSGDICKEASDLGIPLVGVGLMYPQGYFHQHISSEGWQQEEYHQLDFNRCPVTAILSPQGGRPITSLELNNRTLYLGVWQVKVGRVNLYLLDTNLEENAPEDRQLSERLYIAEPELRIQQEIVLGIGGVRLLRALGVHPVLWHANEGHTAFMALERVRQEVEKGVSFAEAVAKVRDTTVFTTHTPVPAGHDVFPTQLVEKYLYNYWESLGIDRTTFLELGQDSTSGEPVFNMTVLALKMTVWRNAVSQRHGQVTRRMWRRLWPQLPEDKVPITHVTNGIHVPTWLAPELENLYEKYLGEDWRQKQDEPGLWQRATDIPDEELWSIHLLLKYKLMSTIRERIQTLWVDGRPAAEQAVALGALLDPKALTIGFVRRFTEYKRPGLIFHNVERLKEIVRNERRPVQIIFVGKSHPADFSSKQVLQRIYTLATDGAFQGRIAFVEDYDMHIAHYLVQGVDVWLNTPRRLQEACGTSGMKASLNGVLHLSVRDGWWYEGYNGANGWAIGDVTEVPDPSQEDKADAEDLYRLLEKEVVPLYYEQDSSAVPRGWVHMMKEAIRSIVPVFCARRMWKDYCHKIYLPALQAVKEGMPESSR